MTPSAYEHDSPTDPALQALKGCYGLLAEYVESEQVVEAAQRALHSGFTRFDAFAPFPVEGLPEAVGKKRTRLPFITLGGGIVGAVGGYGMMYISAVWDFPLNVGGRPLNSWPAFIPITFELTILCAAIATVVGMCALNKLPTPHHPLFDVPEFARATQDHFFLCIEAADHLFDRVATRQFLDSTHPVAIHEVPAWRV